MTTIENRRYYATQIEVEIKQLEVYKKRSISTIERLKNLERSEPILNKIKSLKQLVEKYTEDIEQKNREASDIRSGKKDAEIERLSKESQQEHIQQRKEFHKKKKERKEEKQEKKEKFDKRSKKIYKGYREERYLERSSKKEYEKFVRKCSSIPDYLLRKLKNMPNNKGYIFRGIWLFGERQEEYGQPTIMFDRKNKDLLVIHEYDTDYYKRYEKRGKNRQVLVHKSKRKQLIHTQKNIF